ncbi:hypothetical protein SAMN05444410_101330 [Hydrobacter penzbergensis]|uniref:Uncharacterized protein n=1 Tax=Hydrobacter penzbergensis TaxID=1235997 RepID=A0A8X8LDH4_9BACT|nr:hypothetical protein [Hydrobacter penzbergensis]SDW14129.1 hypothetical protein SAMN05444410_101330 [Hydrobacter penzbergensis]
MCGGYTLGWLDSLITVSLNPEKTDLNTLSDEEICSVISKISEEKEKLLTILKNQIFGLTKEKQIALLVNQSHSLLIILLDQVLKYRKEQTLNKRRLKDLYNILITSLEELLSFIEVRFFAYLSLNERVPVTYLAVTGKELKQRVDKLKTKLLGQETNKELADIVLNSLYGFINRLKEDFPVTFRELLYQKDLLKELELLELPHCETCLFTTLDELLIFLNFNSKSYIGYFTRRLAERLNPNEDIADKLEMLLFHYKQFNQMHRKPGVILNPQYGDLKTELSNWFAQEIFYLEKRLHLTIVPINGGTEQKGSGSVSPKNEPQKLLCILSVDQMALLLRAADDLKIITARSLNAVFKNIVPHLSTPYQENISYDSMRSKSYTAETRDKEIIIQTLQQVIKKIREY